jgi:RNA polymerase sigma-70 factor, ECF subfamily
MTGESRAGAKGFAGLRKAQWRADLRRPRRAAAFDLDPAEERRLVRAAAAGDRAALDRLLRSLSGVLLRYGRAFCGDPDDAEDVRQAVYLALLRTLRTWRGEGSLTSWAYVVARNACARRHRRPAGAREIRSLEAGGVGDRAVELADPRQDPERAADRARARAAIEAALRALPKSQREVVLLRDVEGLSARETGRMLRLSERAVKSRLHRGRLALRATLASWAPDGAGGRHVERAAAGCPDTALWLSRFVEGELGDDACEILSAHMAKCGACAGVCDTLRAALRSCRELGGHELPPPVRRELRDRLEVALAEARAKAAPARGRGARRRA